MAGQLIYQHRQCHCHQVRWRNKQTSWRNKQLGWRNKQTSTECMAIWREYKFVSEPPFIGISTAPLICLPALSAPFTPRRDLSAMAPTRSSNSDRTSRTSNIPFYSSGQRHAFTSENLMVASAADRARLPEFDQAAAEFAKLKAELDKIQDEHCEELSFPSSTTVMNRIDMACKKRGISKDLFLPSSFITANHKKVRTRLMFRLCSKLRLYC
jgi:hypothetical protein